VRLVAVTQRYGDVDVLADVDLEIVGHVVVRGPNGSGKSTLLRIAAGALEPTAGSVVGRPRHVGYVPERFSPPASMRADAYLRRTGRLLGLDATASARRADALLERLDVRPGPRARLGVLSKGNRLKVGLAHAFLAPVDLVVLDEPRDGLDERASAVLAELVDEALARGATVLRATHDDVAPGAVQLRVGGGRVVTDRGPTGRDGGTPRLAARVRDADGTTRTLVLADDERDAALLDVLLAGGSVLDVRPADDGAARSEGTFEGTAGGVSPGGAS
jgi:ABC-type Mn2+/Zn2+ transport system ATPase subunit